ncbi:helix-turn-helix domain-containing protein [Larkinella sp. VNQ87]|uniref:helix-turn-helix domain-containing protein n=1 Tax=Larkinella sp. VNQ87 TaxID=3400921 RepID=UPI003C02D93F
MFNKNDALLDRKSAAKYLNLSPGTLAVWDCTKRYNLNPIKIGRAVRYRKSDLDKFIEQRLWSSNNTSTDRSQ